MRSFGARPLVLLAVAALAAVPVGAQAQPPLRIAWWTDVGFPTPFAFSTLGPGGVVRLTLLYDTLVWKDERGLIPWLAESWRASPDGRAYVFTLRGGVRWHDGRELTAHDVKFTFDYYRKHPFRWVDVSIVTAAEVRDRRTVVLRSREPYAPFLENVAGVVPIVPQHIWRDVTQPERAQELRFAIGSGPYRLAEYRPEAAQYRFVAYDGYFRGRPVVREIHYVLVPTARQVLAVQSGQVDVGHATTYDVVGLFASHPYLRVMQTEPLSIARLIFHMDRLPTSHRSFRRAVAHALDRRRIAETITRGPAPVGSPGVVPPTDPWYNPNVADYPHDRDRARALLRELGYMDRDGDGWLEAPDGQRLAVELVSSPAGDLQLVQQMLAEVGIDVRLRTVDPATRTQLAAEGRFQLLFSTHIGSGGDPDYLRTWFVGVDANQFAVGSVMRSPTYARLAELQLRTLDPTGRRRYVDQMQVLLSQELPTFPLYYRRFFWIYDSRRFTPVATRGGLLNGIPLVENKLAFLSR
ncbi:MAG: ABC transporter substrate-binding protein [Armatimonadota bacterium]|nr:ABC transporter substrate-binding protein [Armatimonadota bacterium]MDR5696870.1 ABC transporter substrate-binding protein [Armatimonadota bacterium]